MYDNESFPVFIHSLIMTISMAPLRVYSGASIPLRLWCISPSVSDSPYFRLYLFPKKFLTTFLLTDHNFFVFPVLVHFPSDSRKFIISSTFQNFPPVFQKFNSFLHTLRVFPPYFDHDAFTCMHHPMHVVDAPAGTNIETLLVTTKYCSNKLNLFVWLCVAIRKLNRSAQKLF